MRVFLGWLLGLATAYTIGILYMGVEQRVMTRHLHLVEPIGEAHLADERIAAAYADYRAGRISRDEFVHSLPPSR